MSWLETFRTGLNAVLLLKKFKQRFTHLEQVKKQSVVTLRV